MTFFLLSEKSSTFKVVYQEYCFFFLFFLEENFEQIWTGIAVYSRGDLFSGLRHLACFQSATGPTFSSLSINPAATLGK